MKWLTGSSLSSNWKVISRRVKTGDAVNGKFVLSFSTLNVIYCTPQHSTPNYYFSFTPEHPLLTYHLNCFIWCGLTHVIWQVTNSKMHTSFSFLHWMCCTITLVARLQLSPPLHIVAALWTKPLEEDSSLMSHVKHASKYLTQYTQYLRMTPQKMAALLHSPFFLYNFS